MSEHEALREQLAATERRLAVARARRDAAEAKVARVEALADEWDEANASGGNGRLGFRANEYGDVFARDLRAALSAPQPADAPEGHGDADEATACNCLVTWDPIRERHVWLNGSLDGSCGHPVSGTPAGERP